jgi:UDP-N-acetylmuramate: L-alanyl-gamma-D-glutamyl-meso-diaminopimelate ligase
MKLGVHQSKLIASADLADTVAWYQPEGQGWDLSALIGAGDKPKHCVYNHTQLLIDSLLPRLANGEQVVIMSNGGFEGIHQRLISALEQRVSR